MRLVVKPSCLFARLNDRLDGIAAIGAGTGYRAADSSRRITEVSTAPTVVSTLPPGDLDQKVTEAA
jgi:hypothetical protein